MPYISACATVSLILSTELSVRALNVATKIECLHFEDSAVNGVVVVVVVVEQ